MNKNNNNLDGLNDPESKRDDILSMTPEELAEYYRQQKESEGVEVPSDEDIEKQFQQSITKNVKGSQDGKKGLGVPETTWKDKLFYFIKKKPFHLNIMS